MAVGMKDHLLSKTTCTVKTSSHQVHMQVEFKYKKMPAGESVLGNFDWQEGALVLEPGPVFAKDGDKNRSEQISYRILRGWNWTTHTFTLFIVNLCMWTSVEGEDLMSLQASAAELSMWKTCLYVVFCRTDQIHQFSYKHGTFYLQVAAMSIS